MQKSNGFCTLQKIVKNLINLYTMITVILILTFYSIKYTNYIQRLYTNKASLLFLTNSVNQYST